MAKLLNRVYWDKIVRIHARKIVQVQGSGERRPQYRITLPPEWARSVPPERKLTVLLTRNEDLIIMHPITSTKFKEELKYVSYSGGIEQSTGDGLLSDFLRGEYSGAVVRKYHRKLDIWENNRRVETFRLTLPVKWVEEVFQLSRWAVILETDGGDLIVLHPENVSWALEGILKANREARIVPSKGIRSSPLWRIYRKYKGGWKTARLFKEGKLPKKKKKNEEKDEINKELTREWGGRKNLIGW
ncbi:hypothetical protein JCM16138_24630 [Thermococcus atlanticus]